MDRRTFLAGLAAGPAAAKAVAFPGAAVESATLPGSGTATARIAARDTGSTPLLRAWTVRACRNGWGQPWDQPPPAGLLGCAGVQQAQLRLVGIGPRALSLVRQVGARCAGFVELDPSPDLLCHEDHVCFWILGEDVSPNEAALLDGALAAFRPQPAFAGLVPVAWFPDTEHRVPVNGPARLAFRSLHDGGFTVLTVFDGSGPDLCAESIIALLGLMLRQGPIGFDFSDLRATLTGHGGLGGILQLPVPALPRCPGAEPGSIARLGAAQSVLAIARGAGLTQEAFCALSERITQAVAESADCKLGIAIAPEPVAPGSGLCTAIWLGAANWALA